MKTFTPIVRTTMPKRGKLVTAYKDGETFRKYCLTYGTIKRVHDWDDPVDGQPMRLYELSYIDGLKASIKMKRGEVISWSYGLIEEIK